MAYGDFKDLTRRTVSGKILCDKAFNIAKSPKYDGYQRSFSMVYNFFFFFDKKTSGSDVEMKICQTSNYIKNYTYQLLEKLENEKYTHLL